MQILSNSRFSYLVILAMALFVASCGNISSSQNGEDSDDENISEEDQLNNKIVFTKNTNSGSEGDINLYYMDPDGQNVSQLTDGAEDGFADISSNGTKIAFHRNPGDVTDKIYTMDINGKNQEQISPEGNTDMIPVWSPDGEKIAFTREDDTNGRNVYVMNADGSNVQQVTDMEGDETASDWSPDGSKIIFAMNPPGYETDSEIYTVNVDNGETTQLTDNSVSENRARYSPDGSQIAFSRADDGKDIFLMNLETGELTQLTDYPEGDLEASWSPDGSQIVFWRYGDTHQIMKMNADGSDAPTQIAEGYEPVWSPVE